MIKQAMNSQICALSGPHSQSCEKRMSRVPRLGARIGGSSESWTSGSDHHVTTHVTLSCNCPKKNIANIPLQQNVFICMYDYSTAYNVCDQCWKKMMISACATVVSDKKSLTVRVVAHPSRRPFVQIFLRVSVPGAKGAYRVS